MISTICEYVDFLQENYSNRIAFQYYDEETEKIQAKTYFQYVSDIRRYAGYLRTTIPQVEGKHIGILARNSYHYAVCFLGTMLAGAVVVPLNLEKTWEEIKIEVEFADLVCLFHDGEFLLREPEIQEKYGDMMRNMEEYMDFSSIVDVQHNIDVEALAIIIFTSGTTGRSKGVMLSQKNMFISLHAFSTSLEMDKMRVFCMLPYYHISGIGSIMNYQAMGKVVNLCCNMKYFYRDIKKMPSDFTLAIPVVLKSWYKDLKKGKRERLGEIKSITCGSAAVDSDMFELFRENGIMIYQGYGLTEIFGAGTVNMCQNDAKNKSVGLPQKICQLKIQNGEICFKSDAVMLGYYKNPEATAEVIRDGWLHTGDLGYLDEDGYLYLTGRKKNLIILSSGENVSPEELEGLLLKNKDIREVVVKEKKEKICAEIFCEEGKQNTIRNYVTEVNRSLAYYMRMTEIEFRSQPFPRTGSGKIKRTESEK